MSGRRPRIVLDEGVPRQLAQALCEQGCDVDRFPPPWRGLQNGVLLKAIEEASYDGLLTCDRNLRFQQSFLGRRLALIVLPAQRMPDLRPIVPRIAAAISEMPPGALVLVERDGSHAVSDHEF